QLAPEFTHRLGRALAAMAEMEVITGDDMRNAEALAQLPANEVLRRHRREPRIESEHGGEMRPEGGDETRLERQGRQPEDGIGGAKETARMRLEGDKAPMRAAVPRFVPRLRQQLLVSA